MVKRRVVLGWGLAASCGEPAALAAPVGTVHRVQVVVQNSKQIKQLPLILAYRLGYFRGEGLDVQLQDLPVQAHSLPNVAQFPAEVFAGTFERTVLQHAQRRPHQAFVLMSRAPQVVLGVSPNALPGHATLKDLVGCSIGVAASGTLSHRVARLMLLRAGLRPTDVNFVEVANADRALEAFHLGEIDALSYTDPVITRLELGGVIRVVSDTRGLRDSDHVFGGPVLCSCLSASREYVEQNGEVCQALTNGVVKALKWLHTATPSDLTTHVPESHMGGDRAVFLAAFNKSRETLATDGTIPLQGPVNVIRALDRLQLNLSLAGVVPAETYTNRFAQRAKAQFKV